MSRELTDAEWEAEKAREAAWAVRRAAAGYCSSDEEEYGRDTRDTDHEWPEDRGVRRFARLVARMRGGRVRGTVLVASESVGEDDNDPSTLANVIAQGPGVAAPPGMLPPGTPLATQLEAAKYDGYGVVAEAYARMLKGEGAEGVGIYTVSRLPPCVYLSGLRYPGAPAEDPDPVAPPPPPPPPPPAEKAEEAKDGARAAPAGRTAKRARPAGVRGVPLRSLPPGFDEIPDDANDHVDGYAPGESPAETAARVRARKRAREAGVDGEAKDNKPASSAGNDSDDNSNSDSGSDSGSDPDAAFMQGQREREENCEGEGIPWTNGRPPNWFVLRTDGDRVVGVRAFRTGGAGPRGAALFREVLRRAGEFPELFPAGAPLTRRLAEAAASPSGGLPEAEAEALHAQARSGHVFPGVGRLTVRWVRRRL